MPPTPQTQVPGAGSTGITAPKPAKSPDPPKLGTQPKMQGTRRPTVKPMPVQQWSLPGMLGQTAALQ